MAVPLNVQAARYGYPDKSLVRCAADSLCFKKTYSAFRFNASGMDVVEKRKELRTSPYGAIGVDNDAAKAKACVEALNYNISVVKCICIIS